MILKNTDIFLAYIFMILRLAVSRVCSMPDNATTYTRHLHRAVCIAVPGSEEHPPGSQTLENLSPNVAKVLFEWFGVARIGIVYC